MKTNIIKMSVVAAMLLSSSAYAGLIKTDANLSNVVVTPDKQFGFGGWDFGNVDVRMINAETGELSGLTFNELDGTYETMTDGDSFASDISLNGTVMGILNGKDWPVGEPAGIKIINGDTTKNGKPENCIMTTSYLDTGYLNIVNPKPTICSSGFQTHKRFKIAMQPASIADVPVAGGYSAENYIDLVFNLDTSDTNTSVQRYQVFSKINNYTDARLSGYKIEVLDANGNENAELTLSLGLGEDNGTDIWGEEDMANFSHGLWGPAEPPHFPDPGFFDEKRAWLPVSLNVDNNIIEATPGAIQGGNYDLLFGHWLPSKWQPYGIFFDTDGDPTTDAKLMAFWGTAPDAPDAAPAWHSGQDYNLTDGDQSWMEPTEVLAELANNNPLYSIDLIEDTLNLGLNYIVEVGDQAKIGGTFIIRITPHVSADQTPPSYIAEDGNPILPPQLIPTPDPIVTPVIGSGGGGGCTYNPNSKNFDMTFLLMMALGLLYPFRRRFIK